MVTASRRTGDAATVGTGSPQKRPHRPKVFVIAHVGETASVVHVTDAAPWAKGVVIHAWRDGAGIVRVKADLGGDAVTHGATEFRAIGRPTVLYGQPGPHGLELDDDELRRLGVAKVVALRAEGAWERMERLAKRAQAEVRRRGW